MKLLLTSLLLTSGANAFLAPSSMKRTSIAVQGGFSWEDTSEHPMGEWQYRPWSGITEENFYPQSQAGNRMFFFPPPAATVGEAAPEGGVASLPPSAPAQAMPEQEQAMPVPNMPANV